MGIYTYWEKTIIPDGAQKQVQTTQNPTQC